MTVTIDDGISPILKKLADRSSGLFNQALHFGGLEVRESIIKSAEQYGTKSNFNQRFVNGYRRITVGKTTKRHYERLDRIKGGKLDTSLAQFTRSKLFPHQNKVVIGYMDTKAFKKYTFKNGIQSPNGRARGTFVSHITEDMFEGGRKYLTKRQEALFAKSGFMGVVRRGYVDRQPHPHMKITNFVGIFEKEAKRQWDKNIKNIAN